MQLLVFIGPQEILIILFVSLVFFLLPVIALIDILKSEFTGNNKLIWVLVILLSWLIGAILFFYWKKTKNSERIKQLFNLKESFCRVISAIGREVWLIHRIYFGVYR